MKPEQRVSRLMTFNLYRLNIFSSTPLDVENNNATTAISAGARTEFIERIVGHFSAVLFERLFAVARLVAGAAEEQMTRLRVLSRNFSLSHVVFSIVSFSASATATGEVTSSGELVQIGLETDPNWRDCSKFRVSAR